MLKRTTRLTLVASVFIPLGFSCSFFGMNLEVLGSGSLSIGYFFLLASLSGLLAWLLSTLIEPIEKFTVEAKRRYMQRYWNGRENINKVTKSMIVSSWIRRNFKFTGRFFRAMDQEMRRLREEYDVFTNDRIPYARFRLLARLFRRAARKPRANV